MTKTLAVTAPDANGDPVAVAVGVAEVVLINWIRVATREKRDKSYEVYVGAGGGVKFRVYRASLGLRKPGYATADFTALDGRAIQVGPDQLVALNGRAALLLPDDAQWIRLSAIRDTVDSTATALLVGPQSDATY